MNNRIRLNFITLISFVLFITSLSAQNIEVEGKANITLMDKDNTADSVVVRQADGTLAVRDVSTLSEFPVSLTLTGSLFVGRVPRSIYVSGRYAYNVDAFTGYLFVIDISDPSTPSLTGSLDIGGSPMSLYVSGRYAYVVDSDSDDLKVIDVSDPSTPSLTGNLDIGGSPMSLYVSGRYAYVVDSDSDDLKVIDILDPSSPTLTGSLAIGGTPISLYLSGRYAYVVDSDSDDLKVIDVSDPSSPALSGSLDIGGGPRSIYVSGRYAYVVDSDSDDLKVIDISDPSSPALSGSLGIGGGPRSIYVAGQYAYVVDSDSGDLKVIDVSDPSTPIIAASLVIGGFPSLVCVSGGYAYIHEPQSFDLKVIDVSGGEYTSLIAHSMEAGNLQVRNDVIVQGQLQIASGLNVGAGGMYSDGDLGVTGSSSFARGAVVIQENGNVGLGDSQPAALLHLNSSATGANAGIKIVNNNNSFNSLFYHDASGHFILRKQSDANQLVLGSNGDIGIRRIPTDNELEVEGIASKTTAGSWLANSDRRIKTDIRDIENAQEIIKELRPVKFKYTEEWKVKHPSIQDQYYYNFIAQEFQEVFPHSVKGSGEYLENNKDEILQIDTYNAQIITISAVQELIKENEILKSELNQLKELVHQIGNDLSNLMTENPKSTVND